ncbi:hypothetical protein F5880DRAFT_1503783 [Lentinula raphanica]|nr:hypothetical protein F5880DRAFT_1503783 [Lentinula raphanica]
MSVSPSLKIVPDSEGWYECQDMKDPARAGKAAKPIVVQRVQSPEFYNFQHSSYRRRSSQYSSGTALDDSTQPAQPLPRVENESNARPSSTGDTDLGPSVLSQVQRVQSPELSNIQRSGYRKVSSQYSSGTALDDSTQPAQPLPRVENESNARPSSTGDTDLGPSVLSQVQRVQSPELSNIQHSGYRKASSLYSSGSALDDSTQLAQPRPQAENESNARPSSGDNTDLGPIILSQVQRVQSPVLYHFERDGDHKASLQDSSDLALDGSTQLAQPQVENESNRLPSTSGSDTDLGPRILSQVQLVQSPELDNSECGGDPSLQDSSGAVLDDSAQLAQPLVEDESTANPLSSGDDTDVNLRQSWGHYLSITGGNFLLDLQIAEFLLNAGALSYLLSTTRLLWNHAGLFRSQPHSIAVGFVVPSVAVFVFVQHKWPRQAPAEKNRILQAAVEVTVFAGACICTSIAWYVLSAVGDSLAAILLAFFRDLQSKGHSIEDLVILLDTHARLLTEKSTSSLYATADIVESIGEGGHHVVESVADFLLELEALRSVALVVPLVQSL